jgi:hypothetical protein
MKGKNKKDERKRIFSSFFLFLIREGIREGVKGDSFFFLFFTSFFL